MRIGVIGAGKIGGTIGGKWEAAGHDVVYGLRDPSKRPGARTIDQALEAGEVVLLAIPGDTVVDFVRRHAGKLDRRPVIDATNDVRGASMNHWAELKWVVPKARLYRAFNTYGWDVFARPELGGERPDLFYAGPAGAGQAQVEQLVTDAGLRPIRVGDTDAVDVVDGVLRLWFTLAQSRGRRIGFRLLAD
jgi:predicted dinucleotide-binding enzyme